MIVAKTRWAVGPADLFLCPVCWMFFLADFSSSHIQWKHRVPDTASYIRGWIQMVLAPNDLFSWKNKYKKYNEYNVTDTFTRFFLSYARTLTLCMLASWSHEGVVSLDFLSSSHSITSSLFPYLGSTDVPCSRLGDPYPPSPKWRPHSKGPRTLPYRDPEHISRQNEKRDRWVRYT